MSTRNATDNVFEPAPEVQLQLEDLVARLLQLGTGSFAAAASDGLEGLKQLEGNAGFAVGRIPVSGGVTLDAGIITPLGSGPFPVVIMPAPLFNLGWKAYSGMLIQLALRGYIALAYSERGLAQSGGEGDVAGEQDRADGSTVIDWVLANYPRADRSRIGFAGSSYGAGQSLLIAAHDERVKVVCAQSAWADLGRSLYENRTPHITAVNALAAVFAGKLSTETKLVLAELTENKVTDNYHVYSRKRSPIAFVDTYNRRNIPIFLGTYWHETIFSVPAVVELYNRLTGPKHLLVQYGDHGGGEAVGFLGGYSRPTATTYRWLAHFLKGAPDEGLVNTVHTEYMYMNLTEDIQTSSSWDSYVLPAVRYYLDAPASGSRDGILSSSPGAGGIQQMIAGVDTPAMVADKLVQIGLQERVGRPWPYDTAAISRENAIVWSTRPFASKQRIAGSFMLHLSVTSSAPTATLVAHLFDLDPATGIARIITSAPYSIFNATANQTRSIDIPLQPADYHLPPGHQLQLIIDTADRLFTDVSLAGTRIQIATSSSASYLDLPIASM